LDFSPEAMAITAMPNTNVEDFLHTSLNPDAAEFRPRSDYGSQITMRPEAAEFIPTAGGWAVLQAAAGEFARQAQPQAQRCQMPFATDEEWRQRIDKREKEVETIKLLTSYRLYIEALPRDQRAEEDPKTPDPRDRTVSKRTWKWNVEKWRLELKSRCVYPRSLLLEFRERSRNASTSDGDDNGSEYQLRARSVIDLPTYPGLPEPPGFQSGKRGATAPPGSCTSVAAAVPKFQ